MVPISKGTLAFVAIISKFEMIVLLYVQYFIPKLFLHDDLLIYSGNEK